MGLWAVVNRGEKMAGIADQFALGLLNFAIGFGAGWWCRRHGGQSGRGAEENPPPMEESEAVDVRKLLGLVDGVDDVATGQESSNKSLRTLIDGYQEEDRDHFEIFTQFHKQTGFLLESYHGRLEEQDPEHNFVPDRFFSGLENSLEAVGLLTEQLEIASEQPLRSLPELRQRLERLEESNRTLRSEISVARRTIEEQAARLMAVESAAYEDFLTKLPNRRAFEQRYTELKAALRRGSAPFAMLLIDLDHFKRVNDTYGHECGDAVLAVVAHVIRDVCRGQDLVSRYGGEEFAVLATETDMEGALTLAERIRSRVEATATRHGGTKVLMTCSIGIAQADTSSSVDQLFEFADQALYMAKEAGRNQVREYTPGRELVHV